MGRKGGANGVGRAFGVSCFVRTNETPGCSRGEKSSQSSEIPLALARGRKGGANGVGRAFGVSCFVRTHETPGFSRGEKSSQHEPKETAMPAGTRRAIAMFTDFFAAADLEATARRTGFVQRTSKITGKLFLAL